MQEKLIEILSGAKGWMTAATIAEKGGWRSPANVGVALQQMEKANGSVVRRKSPTVKQGNGMPATEWRHSDKHFDGDHVPDATKMIKDEPVVKESSITEQPKGCMRSHPHEEMDENCHRIARLEGSIRGLTQRAEVAERNLDDLKKQAEENHRLFLAAARDLGSINKVLDLDSDSGGALLIISAIDDLKSQLETAETANIRWLDLAREYECKTIPELRVFIGALVERIESLRLVALKTLNGEMPGFGALHKALSEGPFVVRCSGAPAIFAKKLDSAKAKALTLARHNTQTFEVFALVPVGKAVRGAEWRASLAGGNRRHYEERK